MTEHHILNRKCRSYIYSCFRKENLNKDGYFFFTCSISFRHLCWDIPGAPWQGRMCGFPFQTGLSCPSHHQGSLLKYIPSVKAQGYRVDGMEQWGGKEVRERCLRLPVAHSLGVQWQAGFLLRAKSAFTEAEITRVCLNAQKRRGSPEATACELTQ